MRKNITDQALDEMRKFLNAASKGPWELYRNVRNNKGVVLTNDYYLTEPDEQGKSRIIGIKAFRLEETTSADDEFIVHAHEDMGMLLNEINILRKGEKKSMNDQKLQEIKERCDAATPGPWISNIEGRDVWGGSSFISIRNEDRDIEPIWASDEDQDFIAAARESIPNLLEEVRQLQKRHADSHK